MGVPLLNIGSIYEDKGDFDTALIYYKRSLQISEEIGNKRLTGISFNNILTKENYNIIGVMSGTSLDGIDIVYVHFEKKEKWTYKVENTITYKYSKEWFEKLKMSVMTQKILSHPLEV